MDQDILYLLRKYLHGRCSESELKKVDDILAQGEYEQEWKAVLEEQALDAIATEEVEAQLSPSDVQLLLERIKASVGIDQPKKPVTKKLWPWLGAAAACLLLLTAGALYYNWYITSPDSPASIVSRYKNDVLPGSDKAVLTLFNGEKIVLDTLQTKTSITGSGITVNKLANGQIAYTVANSGKNAKDPNAWNTISTPKGGQFQVVLPDGSHIWLNAASSIHFPVVFAGEERRVRISGEAYFEVATNKEMPFIVESAGQQVEVLGTHFNINAYPEESHIQTTLLEGAVRVSAGNKSLLMEPGEQVSARPGEPLHVTEVNPEEMVGWVNGEFIFRKQELARIMRSVARWYNVDVAYEGNLDGKIFTGSISRYKNVSEVLKMLELTGLVNFKIEGRRITVMK